MTDLATCEDTIEIQPLVLCGMANVWDSLTCKDWCHCCQKSKLIDDVVKYLLTSFFCLLRTICNYECSQTWRL